MNQHTTTLTASFRKIFFSIFIMCALTLSGCAATIGNVATNSVINPLIVPTVHKSSDYLFSCYFGNAMWPIVQTLIDHGATDATSTASEMLAISAYCYEDPIAAAEVQYQESLRAKRYEAAENALITIKRLSRQATLRYYDAGQYAQQYYGNWGETQCPSFKDDSDKARYAIALTTSLQAVSYNLSSENTVNVPLDILNKVAVSAQCLQNFWGMTDAIQGLVWTANVAIKPENADTWAVLERSLDVAEKSHMRVAHALYANAANQAGDEKRLKYVITRASKLNADDVFPAFKIQDALAISVLTHFSDQLWAKNTGHATPFNRLGTFWDDVKSGAPSDDLAKEFLN